MKILLLGSGGREHALAAKICKSPLCDKLFVAPGNAGTAQTAENADLDILNFEQIATFIRDNSVEMLIVGPEEPLVRGITDFFRALPEFSALKIIGPSAAGARLEGSKDFAKQFMQKYGIPTAAYRTFDKDSLQEGLQYLADNQGPYVLKADGLAAGKGVIITENREEAQAVLREMIENLRFGQAGARVVIEEFLSGIELSVFVLTDGKKYVLLPEAKDYKRIGEGDTGPNTGGMGAVSPVSFANAEFMEKVRTKIIEPTVNGLAAEGTDFTGFIFFGLIKVDGEPMVIEYNVRMGDPETEVVIPRTATDIVELFKEAADGFSENKVADFEEDAATTVILVSGGYPDAYGKGKIIAGLKNEDLPATVFHAGTKAENGKVLTAGGRVLALTGRGADFREALKKSFRAAELIDFEKKNYRRDIGFDL